MEENPLLLLPRPIVEALFESADKEAGRIMQRLRKLEKSIEGIKELFRFTKISGEKYGRVVAADGAMSSGPSSRLGSGFAIYTAGHMAFDGKELVGERYYAGSLSWIEDRKSFKALLKLLMAYAERKAALEAYETYGPDYILLDGPFFYFRGGCRYLRAVKIGVDGIETGLDLIRRVRDMTLELMRTGKAVCVIRRSLIRAIDGWLLYNYGEESCLRARDKHILTLLMPPNSIWAYKDLLGEEGALLYATFYRFYRRWRQEGRSPRMLMDMKEDLMEQSRRDWSRKFLLDLDIEISKVPKTERYYVRYSSEAPPFEVEVVEGTDVSDFARYFLGFNNQATGLPFPVDLIDGMVSLPRGSTTAFTREVEARLIRERSIPNKAAISCYFTYLNPQKEEFI